MTVTNLEYWPPISHVAQLYNSTDVQLQLGGTYQKQSFFNRCKIAGVNGELTLSVPLVGGREQKTLLQNVQIDNTQRWAIQHLRTLRSCYGKAPFFDYYFPKVEQLLMKSPQNLASLNQHILEQVVMWLKWNGQLVKTQNFGSAPQNIPIVLNSYVQVFADRLPFFPNLSILDLLFCTGPSAVAYLKQVQAAN